MAYVITLAHQKGGVGKTTLALNLCSAFEEILGRKAAVIDADVQGSITELLDRMRALDTWKGVPLLEPPHTYETLRDRQDFDFFVIDTPPYLSDQLPRIFDASDFVLVPSKDSPLDALAIVKTLALIDEAQARNPSLLCAIVLNMVKHNTRFTQEILDILRQHPVEVLRTRVLNRDVYKRSLMHDGSVFHSDDPKAIDEMTELVIEIGELIKQHQTAGRKEGARSPEPGARS
jgi:chromosome partitioning protein